MRGQREVPPTRGGEGDQHLQERGGLYTADKTGEKKSQKFIKEQTGICLVIYTSWLLTFFSDHDLQKVLNKSIFSCPEENLLFQIFVLGQYKRDSPL